MIVPVRKPNSNAIHADFPALWRIVAAFGIVYVGYGLNFLAVKIGVETLPAFLFAASHIFCAELLFAIGSIFVRHKPPSDSPVEGAAWMMVFGGFLLATLGLALGESSQIQADDFTLWTLGAFTFLLLVHSLAAFTAMNWLLRHLPV